MAQRFTNGAHGQNGLSKHQVVIPQNNGLPKHARPTNSAHSEVRDPSRVPLTGAQLQAGRQAILARGLPDGKPLDDRPLLHVVWIGSSLPSIVQNCIASWERLNPQWHLCLWTDHRGWINQAQIDRMTEWNGKADIIRYEILWVWGGVVVDADSEAVKPLDDGDFRMCLEGKTTHDAFSCYENEIRCKDLVACGFMGGRPGSAFWLACIEAAALAYTGQLSWSCVGPEMVTRVSRRLKDVLRVYPARCFIPTHHTGTDAPGDAPIFAKQLWGNTHGLYAR